MKYKIVLVRYPFDDNSLYKIRPVLCITNSIGKYDEIVVCYITSQLIKNPVDTDIIIDYSHPEFSLTGLKNISKIRIHKVMTINTTSIIGVLGYLPDDLSNKVVKNIKRLFQV